MTKYFCYILLIWQGTSRAQQPLSKADSLLFSQSKFRPLGPFRGGRSAAVCGDQNQKNTFYMGTTGGGVWKTTDGGSNWKNISDGYFGGSIGAVAQAPSDPSILYVGEGENTIRGNVSEGFGMWRSDDGGRKWRFIGLKESRHIVRIVIHPKNPDIVWVAALGHLFGPHQERGVFKTTDGGKNWKKVLYADDQSGAVDLVMEPNNPSVLYASTWTVKRTPYSLESGGNGSALWKSTDGGESWQNLNKTEGFPSKTTLGIIGIAVSAQNPDKVYALIENQEGGLYLSEDGGKKWKLVNSENKIRQRAWYFSKVFLDPGNDEHVYVLNVEFHKSENGGQSFKEIETPHGDHHDLWIDPEQSQRMIIADDGGAQVSFDGGNNWSTYMNQATAQFYRVSTDNHFPYRILGAQQDNTTVRILSETSGGQIDHNDWSPTAGFESGYVVADPQNPEIVYGGNYAGYLSRYDHKTGENRSVSVWPDVPIGEGADAQKYRFQWNFPIFFSPHQSNKLYAAGNMLFVSENEGKSWKAISPDLTTNDKEKQKPSGGPITKDNTTVEYYCTIFAATECHLEKGVLWTGSDDGLIHISRDGGQNWTNVTPPDAPKGMMWNSVETDPHQKGKVWFVGTRYKSDDFAPYIYMSENYGKSWKKLVKGIPATHFTRVLRADAVRKGLLYCGTEYGFYVSFDDGANWQQLQLNLPKVPITDMCLKNTALIIATQGRSFWVMDDLSDFRQYEPKDLQKSLYLFPCTATVERDGYRSRKVVNAGENPIIGARIRFYLKTLEDSSKVSVKIFDEKHLLVRSYDRKSSDKKSKLEVNEGMNTMIWDLDYPGIKRTEGMILWNGQPVNGPDAAPGKYYIRLVADKDSMEQELNILPNPVYNCSVDDYRKQFDFLMSVQQKFEEVQTCIKNLRLLRSQIEQFQELNSKRISVDLKKMGDSLCKQLTTIENELYQTKLKSGQDILNYPMKINDRIAGLYNFASSGRYAPTEQVIAAYEELKILADKQLETFKKLSAETVSQYNEMIRKEQVPVIGVKEK